MINLFSRSIFIVLSSIVILFAQDLPHWVEETPIDSNYYYARENVGVMGLSAEEYKAKANAQAFKTISMQIRITVSSQAQSSFTETMTESDITFKDEFEQKSSTSTIADIQGAEMVGDHTTSTTYWVLWRLKKSVHAENMKKFVDAAKNQYEGFINTPSDDPVGQLQFLIPAYEAVIKVAGVPVVFDGKNLKVEIPNQISAILNSLRLMSDGETELTGQTGYPLGRPLKVKVKAGKNMNVADIPIIFLVESGELAFSQDMVLTSSSGRTSTKVTNILSRRSVQQVRAMIDLKEWREDRLSELVSFEKRLYEISRANSVLFTLDIKQVTQEKIAVITVGDTSVYNEDDLKRLNSDFRSEFADVTDFKLKDEMLIEGIIDSYKRSANLCSNEECQIQIGKKLGVERLVFVDIANYPKQTSVNLFLRNIAENELELQKGYDFPHKEWRESPPEKPNGYGRARSRAKKAEEDLDKGEIDLDKYDSILTDTRLIIDPYDNAMDRYKEKFDSHKVKMINDILDNVSTIVEDFWIRTNPGRLTLNCKSRGVKGEFTFLDHTKWMDETFEKRLPIRDERFLEGSYELDINKLGYEKYHMRFDVAMGEFPEYDVNLKPKRPGKAFFRSFLIPGRGQIYSSDADNRGRLVMGMTYFVSTMACVGVSGYLWNDFSKAKDTYEVAKLDYQNAVDINDVSSTQSIMSANHIIMSDKRSTAVLVTGLTVGLWVFNAIDAALFFPAEYKGRRLSMNVSPQFLAGEPGAKTKLSWNF
jgi:hypothetical protein